MGIVRLLLALSVVLFHSGHTFFVGGKVAVQAFYILSGYLIYQILVDEKQYHSTFRFYVSRVLRIFPIYWCLAFLTVTAIIVADVLFESRHSFISMFLSLDWLGKFLFGISNIVLIGQDWLLFTVANQGKLQWSMDPSSVEHRTWDALLIPPSWTLGLELTFYLLAPFILQRSWALFAAFGISGIVKFALLFSDFGNKDPWTYRFFPAELFYFTVGALSCKYVKPASRRLFGKSHWHYYGATSVMVLLMAFYPLFPNKFVASIGFKAALAMAIPFLMSVGTNAVAQVDRKIGDLSYPLYLNHMLILWIVAFIMQRTIDADYQSTFGAFLIVGTSIVFAIALSHYVEGPINALRSNLRSNRIN